jgi:hypothetical protein
MTINHSSFSSSARRLCAVALTAIAGAAALCGCTPDPRIPGPILSRLPPGQPGAAPATPTLSEQERQRYDAIDKQVMQEQNQAMAAQAWARDYAPYYTPYYYPTAPVVFGGYYGGWNSGVGVGYGAPPGWW